MIQTSFIKNYRSLTENILFDVVHCYQMFVSVDLIETDNSQDVIPNFVKDNELYQLSNYFTATFVLLVE